MDCEQYYQKAKEILQEAQTLYSELDVLLYCQTLLEYKTKWTHVTEKNGVRMYKYPRPDVSPLPCYWIEATYNKPKDELVNKIWLMDEETAKKYDPKISMWKVVENGDDWKVCSQYINMTWPLYPRHIVYAQVKINEYNVTYLVSFSVDRPDVITDIKTHVRSQVNLSVYAYKDNGNNTTTVWRMLQVNPYCDVPTGLMEYFSNSMMNAFLSWKNE